MEKEIEAYLTNQVTLGPLGTTEILVERHDATGGSGANFLVDWVATNPVSQPIIEAVMIDPTGIKASPLRESVESSVRSLPGSTNVRPFLHPLRLRLDAPNREA